MKIIRAMMGASALLFVGCNAKPVAKQEVEAPLIEARAEPPAAAAVERPAHTATLDGLELALFDDGRYRLRGNDLWGAPIDTTYESREFLEKALPTLALGLKESQVAALRGAITP